MTKTLGPRPAPTECPQHGDRINKGHNAANINLMKNKQCEFMKIQLTNMKRSGITLLPLWECLLSMKG